MKKIIDSSSGTDVPKKLIRGGGKKMIAVLSWVDGFGADTLVEGIFETLEQAQQYFPWDRDEETPRKYQEFNLNEETFFDYYGQPYLHKRKRKVYRIVKWKKKERV